METIIASQDEQKRIDHFYHEFVNIINANSHNEEIKEQRLTSLHKTFYTDATETEYETTTVGIKTIWQLKNFKFEIDLKVRESIGNENDYKIYCLMRDYFISYDKKIIRISLASAKAKILTRILEISVSAEETEKDAKIEFLENGIKIIEAIGEIHRKYSTSHRYNNRESSTHNFLKNEIVQSNSFGNLVGISYSMSSAFSNAQFDDSLEQIRATLADLAKKTDMVVGYYNQTILSTCFEVVDKNLNLNKSQLDAVTPSGFMSGLTQEQKKEKEQLLIKYIDIDAIDKFKTMEFGLFDCKKLNEEHKWQCEKTRLIDLCTVLSKFGYFKYKFNKSKKTIQEFHKRQFISERYGFGSTGLKESFKKYKPTIEKAISEFNWIPKV